MDNIEMHTFIYVCSPYGGLGENYKKALTYGRYVVDQGYTPIIPHTMLHGILKDQISAEREMGLNLGQALLKMCSEVWVFGSEPSVGMRSEIELAGNIGIPVQYITDVFNIRTRTEVISQLMRTYEQLNGIVSRIICDDVVDYLNHGMSDKLIEAAMKCAARAGAKWNYARAILERCLHDGITTEEQFNSGRKSTSDQSGLAAYDVNLFEKMLNEDD